MSKQGACSCGAVRYQFAGDLNSPCFCHCESCRKASGAPYVAWGTVDLSLLSITGDMGYFSSSEGVRRGFCKHCGTSLSYQHSARPDHVDITLASLDDNHGLEPQCHIWVSDKLESVIIGDDLPQYQGWRSDG